MNPTVRPRLSPAEVAALMTPIQIEVAFEELRHGLGEMAQAAALTAHFAAEEVLA